MVSPKSVKIYAPTKDSQLQCLKKLDLMNYYWLSGQKPLEFSLPEDAILISYTMTQQIYYSYISFPTAVEVSYLFTDHITFRKEIWNLIMKN